MYCKNCGTKVVEGASFCPQCGSSYQSQSTLENSFSQVPDAYSQNSLPTRNNNKKKDGIFFIVIAIVGIALIALPIIIGLNKDNTFKENPSHDSNYISNSKEVTFKNFTFQMPEGSSTEIDGDSLYIYHLRDNDSFGILGVEEGNFEQLKASKAYVKSYMQSYGYEVGDVSAKTYGGVEFLIAPIKQNNYRLLLTYAKLTDEKVAMVVVANNSYDLDYDLLNVVAPIIKSGRKTGDNPGTVGV